VENRKDKRFEEQNNVLIQDKSMPAKSAAGRGVNALTHDISLSGAWIHCQRDFPVGYVVRIIIDLDGKEPPLDVDGEVIWTRKSEHDEQYDFGVEFLHRIPDTIVTLIRHFYGKDAEIPSTVS